MMMDVDSLSRRFGPLIAHHCAIENLLHIIDTNNRSSAYKVYIFTLNGENKMKETGEEKYSIYPMIIASVIYTKKLVSCPQNSLTLLRSTEPTISSYPVLVTSARAFAPTPNSNKDTQFRMIDV